MRRNISSPILFLISAAVITSGAQSKSANNDQIVNPPVPKGAVHLVVRNDAEARKVFAYFPYPQFPDWYHPDETRLHPPDLGIYRIEVAPKGNVSAVTILKSANRMMDVISMKTFVSWRAKPGALRVVDVHISFGTRSVGGGPLEIWP